MNMTYAKQTHNGEVIALLTYDFEPHFDADSDTVIITEDEYNGLFAEMQKDFPKPDPEQISDSEALRIITGEVDADETE